MITSVIRAVWCPPVNIAMSMHCTTPTLEIKMSSCRRKYNPQEWCCIVFYVWSSPDCPNSICTVILRNAKKEGVKKYPCFYAFPIAHHDIKRARAPCRAFHRGASECSQMQCVNQARASFGPQFWQKIVERRHITISCFIFYSYLIRLTVLLELFRTTKLALQWIKSNFNLCLLCSGLILPPLPPFTHTCLNTEQMSTGAERFVT